MTSASHKAIFGQMPYVPLHSMAEQHGTGCKAY